MLATTALTKEITILKRLFTYFLPSNLIEKVCNQALKSKARNTILPAIIFSLFDTNLTQGHQLRDRVKIGIIQLFKFLYI